MQKIIDILEDNNNMPKVKPAQNLPKKYTPILHTNDIAPVSSESEVNSFLLSPKKEQREAALIFLLNYEMHSLHKVITREMTKAILEMIVHEGSDMSSLALGVLRNFIQEIINYPDIVENMKEGVETQTKLLNEFDWNLLIDSLLQIKDTEIVNEWLKIVRVLCCADISTLVSVTQESKEKFIQIMNKVALFLKDSELLGTIHRGDGAFTIWEALYIFFVWTDQNVEACRLLQSNQDLIQILNRFITEKLPPQRIITRKSFGMKYRKLTEDEMESFDVEEVDEQGNVIHQPSTSTVHEEHDNIPKDYPAYIRIIAHAILFNIQISLNPNEKKAVLASISNTFDALATLMQESKPGNHLEELVHLISSVHLTHQESEKIRDDWRLPIEGEKLGMEVLANLISYLAYDIHGPKAYKNVDDESSKELHFYNFLTQKNILVVFFEYLSSMMQPRSNIVLSKIDFVTDQVNIIEETFVSTLACFNNILLATVQERLVEHLSTFQSLFHGLCKKMMGKDIPSVEIMNEFQEHASLFLWTMLRKLDDINISIEEANFVSSLAGNHASAEVRRNSIGILREVGCRDHTIEQNKVLGEIFLARLSDKSVLVSIESLNALFAVYGDDYFNENVKALQMIAKLEIFMNQVFMQKFKSQIETLDECDKELVEEAISNLKAFIEFKKKSL